MRALAPGERRLLAVGILIAIIGVVVLVATIGVVVLSKRELR